MKFLRTRSFVEHLSWLLLSIIIEYQKIINLVDNTPNQPSKFNTENWIKINDESQRTYNEANQIRFKYSMLISSLCDYSDAYIHFKGTITVLNNAVQDQTNNVFNKKEIFKNCAPSANCITRINNMQVDDAHYFDVLMPMCNLIENSDDYSETSGTLWQYFIDEAALNNGEVVDFNAANATTDSSKIKSKIKGQTGDDGTKNVNIIVPLKDLSNFGELMKCL